MKLLTVSALLCAMMALTTAADEGGSNVAKGSVPPGEHLAEKRFFWHRYWGWTRYGNRQFRYIAQPMIWAQAQRYCESMNANLASVRNLAEYRIIQRVIFRATYRYITSWIGGTDAQQEGYWFWIDGTPFSFTYWCRGEPNNAGGRENCLHMNFSGNNCMNDIPCYFQYPFVCVRKIR